MTNPLIEAIARAVCRVQINGGDPDQPAIRWNGTQNEPQEFPAWHDYRDEAQAALGAIAAAGYAVVPALSEVKDDMLMDAQQAFNDAVQLQQRGLSEWTIRMQAAINVLSKKPD